jgi:hypothetical protein
MKDYERKLSDPRWQRRRLEIMQQRGWKCEICGDEKEELNIHHPSYEDGANPWEYRDGSLKCLCRTCHTIMHLDQEKVKAHAKRLCVETTYRRVTYFESPLRKALLVARHLGEIGHEAGRVELLKVQQELREETQQILRNQKEKVEQACERAYKGSGGKCYKRVMMKEWTQ